MRRSRIGFVRLTVSQVARRLRTTVRRARALAVRGPLDAIRSGHRVLVELDAVERYLKKYGSAA